MLFIEEFFSVKCCHASKACRGNGLTIHLVCNITSSKYARHIGRCGIALNAAANANIAIIHVDLAGKYIGIWLVANGDEDASGGNVLTEAAIDGSLTRDLYVALGEPIDQRGAWALRLYVKPFIRWIWLGALLMAIGGFTVTLDKRFRRPVDEASA